MMCQPSRCRPVAVALLLTLTACANGNGGAARLGSEQDAELGSGQGPGAGTDGGTGGTPKEDPPTVVLRVEPSEAVLVVSSRSAPAAQEFKAFVSTEKGAVDVRWSISGELANVSDTGIVQSNGLRGGEVELRAHYGKLEATARVRVRIELEEMLGTAPVSPENRAALAGAPTTDPGLKLVPPNPTKILYPYDGTVMPRGLSSPELQLSPGSIPPQDLEVAVRAEGFAWTGLVHVADPARPGVILPEDVWGGALSTARGGKVTIEVVKAANGLAYGPAEVGLTAADGSLKGAVYYMTYEDGKRGLWSTRPSVREPPKQIVAGCTVCHSASSNGARLSTGAEGGGALSGVYNIGADGSATQLTGSPAGLGGDSRGLSYATFTPNGRYVMRSQSNFWGGLNQLAWKIDDAAKALIASEVVGLGATVSAYLPAFSHDGRRYAFTNGAGEPAAFGTVSRSLSIMDVKIDDAIGAGGRLTFTNRKLLLDNGAAGSVVKFVTFLPDPNQLVFQEGERYLTDHGEMLPTWDANGKHLGATGRLATVHGDGTSYVKLDRLNRGNADVDRERNYEPFSLPVSVGGYFWVVFTSIRDYGHTYAGAGARKQLWVAAISPNAAAGDDPSHPPFLLPNQGATRNERGFWALEPCHADGVSCETGDECCGGFCRTADASDPNAGKVCKPDEQSCSELHERCEASKDCCQVAEGAQCIGGFCDIPAITVQ